jgi:hypothetical protein
MLGQFTWDSPVTVKDFYPPSEKTIEAYRRRINARWDMVAAYTKRAFTSYSILGMLALSVVTTAATIYS